MQILKDKLKRIAIDEGGIDRDDWRLTFREQGITDEDFIYKFYKLFDSDGNDWVDFKVCTQPWPNIFNLSIGRWWVVGGGGLVLAYFKESPTQIPANPHKSDSIPSFFPWIAILAGVRHLLGPGWPRPALEEDRVLLPRL